MKYLFVHPNMPGQYKHIARIAAEDEKNQVVFITKPKPGLEIPNVTKIEYKVEREASPDVHSYLVGIERAVYESQDVWRICKKLKDKGFVPDIIIGHFGWGNGFFLKDIYPDSPILSLMEFYYNAGEDASDMNFLGDEEITPNDTARIRMKNIIHQQNLTYSDWGICPTHFQFKQNPDIFYPKLSVLHDGIDVDVVKPRSDLDSLTLPNGVKLKKGDEIITYISRNFEPYRGFPTFMRAAEIILKNRPNAHIVMVGQDGVSYGKKPQGNKTYRQMMMEEVTLPEDRFHFLGYLPYDQMVKVMQISSAHIYLTVPFVLSWSMLEAMACGCAMITSDTAPIHEVITHEKNGLIVDFFSPEEVAGAVDKIIEHKDRMQDMRDEARKTVVERYALNKLLPYHFGIIKDLAEGHKVPPTAVELLKFNQQYIPEMKDLYHEKVKEETGGQKKQAVNG